MTNLSEPLSIRIRRPVPPVPLPRTGRDEARPCSFSEPRDLLHCVVAALVTVLVTVGAATQSQPQSRRIEHPVASRLLNTIRLFIGYMGHRCTSRDLHVSSGFTRSRLLNNLPATEEMGTHSCRDVD